jgi:hypothetical protein
MIAPFVSLLSVIAIGLAAYGVGRPILNGLGLGGLDRLSHAVWSLAVGLIACGTLLTAMGFAGVFYVPAIGVLSLAGCFWGIGQIFSGVGRRYERRWIELDAPDPESQPDRAPWPSPPRWMRRGGFILAGLACLGSLLAALAPPTAGDALCYHLELPKVFLADHGLTFLVDNVNSTFPALVQMWYLWGLALDGPVAAGLIHWGLGVLLALATVVLATPLVGRPWAWIAGAVVVLVPGVNNQMTAPLVDVALALLTTLALAAWWQAVVADGGRRWFLLAGLAAGGALGTKYLAAVFAAAVAAHAAWLFVRSRCRRCAVLEGAAIVAVVAASVAGPWYVRAAWHHQGNPVYPFLSEMFTESAPSDDCRTLPPNKSPLGRSVLALAAAPWEVTMHPERFGGRGHQLGVLFLAAAPGVLIARRLRGLGMFVAVAGAYSLLWFLLRQNVRFMLPAVPPLAVAVVWVWIEMRRMPTLPRRLAAGAFAAALAAYAAVGLMRSEGHVAVALGLESRPDYLAAHEPTWLAAEMSNGLLGPDAHLLSQDYRAFYFDCKVTRESLYRQRTGYDRQITDPSRLSRYLRSQGFTHLLLAENQGTAGIEYDPTLTRLVEAQWAAGDELSLANRLEYRFIDADGAVRRYRLVLLQ